MGAWRDLTGQVFGKLTVLEYKKGRPYSYWLCQCTCGNQKLLKAGNLKAGETKSCGCRLKELHDQRREDLTGQKFGRWTVESYGPPDSRAWHCKCDCGNTGLIYTQNLQRGNSTSCGCYNSEVAKTNAHDITGERFGMLVALEREYSNPRKTHWKCQCDCGNTTVTTLGNLRSGGTKTCGCTKNDTLSWNQRKRMPDDAPRSLYIYCHPTLKDHYKIGIAVKPKYRAAPCYGSLLFMDSVKGKNIDIAYAERRILKRTKHLAQCPEDMKQYAGASEWRVGEEAVEIWHEEARSIEQITD